MGKINPIYMSDFYGYLGYLLYQEENGNRKMINRFIKESELLLMIIDDKCKGH